MIKLEEWKPVGGLTLEPNALRAAMETENCLALTAGPGAGKTEMLAQRADFLLRTGVCRYPYRILAISFKVDASRNLKERVRTRCGSELAQRFDSFTFHSFAKQIIDRFRLVLTGKDALDPDYKIGSTRVTRAQITFNDLIPLATQIINSSKVARNAVRNTYRDVFLDEFQDCTNSQYELIKSIFLDSKIRLVAVGDTKQKIMAWAGALEGIFINFAQDFNAVPLNMYLNFRSEPKLLRMQNEIIRVLDAASVMEDGIIIGDGGEVFVWKFDNSQDEAIYLANQILSWIEDDDIPYSEIAILIRQQPDLYASYLFEELELRNIPYRNEQHLQDISVEPVARLIVDYLISLYGTKEPSAWVRLMNLIIPFADDEEVQETIRQDWFKFIKAERKNNKDMMEFLDDGWPSGWESVKNFLKKFGQSNLKALSADYESPGRLDELIDETKTRIDELVKIEPDLVKALYRFSDNKAVRVLTIHKSKGLEFEAVIMFGVEKETFWGKLDENRCTYFVGVSRAKSKLVLTHVDVRPKPDSAGIWNTNRNPHNEFLDYAYPFTTL